MMKRKGFTLIELIFVIVIAGIVSMIGYSQWGEVLSESRHVQVKSTIANLRTALALDRQRLSLQGEYPYRQTLDSAQPNVIASPIFEGNTTHPLIEGVKQSNDIGGWIKQSERSYVCKISSTQSVTLTYDPSLGRMVCSGEGCSLVE
jgi:general secretion pathway protein G